MNESPHLKQAYLKIAKYCASKECSHFQVRKKLKSWELSEVEINDLILRLKHESFISEERFSRAYVHDKFEFNKWGRFRIRMGLKQHDLPDAVISSALDSIDEVQYKETLRALGFRKYSLLSKEENEFKRVQKATNYLLNKGFERDLINEILNDLTATNHS